jgi:curli production assembly/transport component CsgE
MNAAFGVDKSAFGPLFRACVAACSIAVSLSCAAAEAPARTVFRVPDELRGIVTNQTLTPLGQEFYSRFNDFWREYPEFEEYSFVVAEKHSKRYGSQIVVTYRQQTLYTGNLPYRYGQIRAYSAEVADKVHTQIVGLSLRAAANRDPDIADDEF